MHFIEKCFPKPNGPYKSRSKQKCRKLSAAGIAAIEEREERAWHLTRFLLTLWGFGVSSTQLLSTGPGLWGQVKITPVLGNTRKVAVSRPRCLHLIPGHCIQKSHRISVTSNSWIQYQKENCLVECLIHQKKKKIKTHSCEKVFEHLEVKLVDYRIYITNNSIDKADFLFSTARLTKYVFYSRV